MCCRVPTASRVRCPMVHSTNGDGRVYLRPSRNDLGGLLNSLSHSKGLVSRTRDSWGRGSGRDRLGLRSRCSNDSAVLHFGPTRTPTNNGTTAPTGSPPPALYRSLIPHLPHLARWRANRSCGDECRFFGRGALRLAEQEAKRCGPRLAEERSVIRSAEARTKNI